MPDNKLSNYLRRSTIWRHRLTFESSHLSAERLTGGCSKIPLSLTHFPLSSNLHAKLSCEGPKNGWETKRPQIAIDRRQKRIGSAARFKSFFCIDNEARFIDPDVSSKCILSRRSDVALCIVYNISSSIAFSEIEPHFDGNLSIIRSLGEGSFSLSGKKIIIFRGRFMHFPK